MAKQFSDLNKNDKVAPINENIKAAQVRLIGADGQPVGIVAIEDALAAADEANLDLVLVAEDANPPVCKVMNYGKYRFDTLKREKEAKKKQKVAEVKGMQLSMNIADYDLGIKAKNVRKNILAGDKVKVTLKMHGRQLANPQMGLPIMEKFSELVADVADVTSKPEINGRQIIMVLSPKK